MQAIYIWECEFEQILSFAAGKILLYSENKELASFIHSTTLEPPYGRWHEWSQLATPNSLFFPWLRGVQTQGEHSLLPSLAAQAKYI